jgi:putative transposase
MLRAEGLPINRKRVQRLMRRMGIAALGPKPNTSKPAPGHKIYPYLLRGLAIERVNQLWAADITCSPIGAAFLYLVAIIDWASRAVLSWRLSNTMDVSFCIAALQEALAKYGAPKIFNTDQGSQFTSTAFTGLLVAAGIAISMDERGRWMDNVFIERLWRTLKHEDIYLRGYADGGVASRRGWSFTIMAAFTSARLSSADGGLARRGLQIRARSPGWRTSPLDPNQTRNGRWTPKPRLLFAIPIVKSKRERAATKHARVTKYPNVLPFVILERRPAARTRSGVGQKAPRPEALLLPRL